MDNAQHTNTISINCYLGHTLKYICLEKMSITIHIYIYIHNIWLFKLQVLTHLTYLPFLFDSGYLYSI